jgi:drug/metabolite transporter (DMT)-like permease
MDNQTTARGFGLTDALLVATAVIWGFNVVLVKISLAELSPLPFNSLRFLLAAGLSWLLLRVAEPGSRVKREDIPVLIGLGLLGHSLYQILFISGINLSTAGNTSLLLATSPIWVAVLSSLFGLERLQSKAWGGILLSFSGICLVTVGGGKDIGFGSGSSLGDLLILAGTLVFAIYTVRSKQLLTRYSPLQFSTYTMIPGALALLVVSTPALLHQDFGGVSLAAWGGLLYSGIFAIVIAYYVWNNGVQKLGAARTAIYNNLSPVVAMVAGVMILQEQVSLPQLAGAALIVVGLYLTRSSKSSEGVHQNNLKTENSRR